MLRAGVLSHFRYQKEDHGRLVRTVLDCPSSRTSSVWEEKEGRPEKVQAADLAQWSLMRLELEFPRHVHVGKPCGEAWQYPVQELQALYPGRAQVEGIKESCALQLSFLAWMFLWRVESCLYTRVLQRNNLLCFGRRLPFWYSGMATG